MFRNLLIADSGTGHVEEMVRMLQDIPSFGQAKVNLLHVVPEQSKSQADDHRSNAEQLLNAAMQRMGLDASGVNALVREGDPKQTVLNVANELSCDLIVMGSRGLGRLQSILANSTSQYVFQLSTRPMLLVRDDLYVRHINRVMVTVDGTGVGDDAIRVACELVRDIPGGTLTGVHVSRQDITPTRGGRSKADVVLDAAVQRARTFGVDLKPIHATGTDIGRTVCGAAQESQADLVVIASQDRRPLVARGLVDLDKLWEARLAITSVFTPGACSARARAEQAELSPAPCCWSGCRESTERSPVPGRREDWLRSLVSMAAGRVRESITGTRRSTDSPGLFTGGSSVSSGGIFTRAGLFFIIGLLSDRRCWPCRGPHRECRLTGRRQTSLCIGQTHLRTGEHKQRAFNKGLAGQAPILRTATQLGLFHSRAGRQSIECILFNHRDKTGDALTAATAVSKLTFQAVELNSFPKRHVPEVLAGITLNIATLSYKSDDRHWGPRRGAPLWEEGLRFVNTASRDPCHGTFRPAT